MSTFAPSLSGRRDGRLGQQIYNEIRKTEGGAKEKEARAQLATRWRQGVVTWSGTQVQIELLQKKMCQNRMQNPLHVLRAANTNPIRKLAFEPKATEKAKVLTSRQKRFSRMCCFLAFIYNFAPMLFLLPRIICHSCYIHKSVVFVMQCCLLIIPCLLIRMRDVLCMSCHLQIS